MAKFEHFRAYAADTGVKTKWSRKAQERTVRKEWDTEEVVLTGKANADGQSASFDAGDTVITRVVFLTGKKDDETVVGSVDVGKSGSISVTCPDPEELDDDED